MPLKSLIALTSTLVALASASVSAWAEEWSAQDRTCAKGVYCIEDLICVGRIAGPVPPGMHESYYTQAVRLQSFKSVKNTSEGKVLVDTLGLSWDFGRAGQFATLDDVRERDLDTFSFGSPAYRSGNTVRTSMSTANFSEGLKFTITGEWMNKKGQLVQLLIGKDTVKGSVVGDYSYEYDCEATLTDAPTRVIDRTR